MMNGTILVTGGCGYVGAHLVRALAERGEWRTIRILDNLSRGAPAALLDLPEGPRYEFHEGDLLDPAAVRLALEGVDAVAHLAAVAMTPFSFEQPRSVTQVNRWGTARLLEHCQEAGVRRFVFASSASVYGPGGPFEETAPCRPIGAYSHSKLEAERAVLAAQAVRPTVLRFGICYGGKPGLTRFDAVANRFAYLAGIGRSLTVYGSGEQTRPLVHVEDAARAVAFALGHDAAVGETYNVVEASPSIGELAERVAKLRPGTRVRYTDQDYRQHYSLALDGEKLRAAGWQPEERLEAGIANLLQHFRGFQAAAALRAPIEE